MFDFTFSILSLLSLFSSALFYRNISFNQETLRPLLPTMLEKVTKSKLLYVILNPEHLVVSLAGPISHTSTQYTDFVDFLHFNGSAYQLFCPF